MTCPRCGTELTDLLNDPNPAESNWMVIMVFNDMGRTIHKATVFRACADMAMEMLTREATM